MTSASTMLADNMVAVVSNATAEYLKERATEQSKKTQSYVIMEGKLHRGSVVDRTLERTQFADIARQLAGDLKARSFVPAQTLAGADLLLVVHWGVTARKQSDKDMRAESGDEMRDLAHRYSEAREFERTMMAEGRENEIPTEYWAISGSSTMRSEMVFQDATEAHAKTDAVQSQVSNAQKLGLSTVLAKEEAKVWQSEEGRTLRAMLDEERYFIIVNAYDCRALLKQAQLRRLWSTKLNIRAHGVNFTMALERMGHIGRMFYGTHQVGMVIKPARIKEGQVEIGDLIVIESRER